VVVVMMINDDYDDGTSKGRFGFYSGLFCGS